MDENNGNQNLENLSHQSGNYEAQRCPVCKGFGTVNYGKQTCKSCSGRGMVYVPKRRGVPDWEPASNQFNTSMQSDEAVKR